MQETQEMGNKNVAFVYLINDVESSLTKSVFMQEQSYKINFLAKDRK